MPLRDVSTDDRHERGEKRTLDFSKGAYGDVASVLRVVVLDVSGGGEKRRVTASGYKMPAGVLVSHIMAGIIDGLHQRGLYNAMARNLEASGLSHSYEACRHSACSNRSFRDGLCLHLLDQIMTCVVMTPCVHTFTS